MKLSDKIWVCRKKAGLSQEALAERIGVSRQAISKWETGEASPEISKLPLLARTFGVTADWLLDDAADPEEEASPDAPGEEAAPAAGAESDAAPASAYPSWVENLPGWIGRMIKRFGWIFGVRIAISGALFTAMGFAAKAMFASMGRMASDGFNRVESIWSPANENAGMIFYDNAGNVIDPAAWGIDVSQFGAAADSSLGFGSVSMSVSMGEPFAILCNLIIGIGIVLLIGGVLLAWYLKRWGKQQS